MYPIERRGKTGRARRGYPRRPLFDNGSCLARPVARNSTEASKSFKPRQRSKAASSIKPKIMVQPESPVSCVSRSRLTGCDLHFIPSPGLRDSGAMDLRACLPLILCATCLRASAALAQEIPPPRPFTAQPPQPSPPPEEGAAPPLSSYFAPDTAPTEAPPTSNSGTGIEAESLPGELAEDIFDASDGIRLGPTAVSNVRFLMDGLGLDNWLSGPGIRTFGWVEGGYSGASTGTGPLSVQPRQNRYGNEFLLNQIGFVFQRPLRQDQFDIGFNVRILCRCGCGAWPA